MACQIRHPLEPLSAAEVQQAVGLLKSAGKVTPTTRFVSVSLKEPRKELVHAFKPGEPIEREAFAVLFDNATNVATRPCCRCRAPTCWDGSRFPACSRP